MVRDYLILFEVLSQFLSLFNFLHEFHLKLRFLLLVSEIPLSVILQDILDLIIYYEPLL